MKKIWSLGLFLALLGCAQEPEWSKPGVSSQLVAAELADCRSQARVATQRDTNIMNDIMATRGNDWRQTGVLGMQKSVFSAEDYNRTSSLIDRCMIDKGYVPGD